MPQGLKQLRNEQLVRNLSTDFQVKYDAAYHWSRACSQFLALPGLRGFWPMSSFNEAGNAYDLSGQGRTLTYNGNPTYNHDSLAPFITLDGTGDYLSRADEAGLDILGTEGYVAAGARGLTMGGWFYATDDASASHEYLMAKVSGAPQDSYGMYRRPNAADERVEFWIDAAGAVDTVISASAMVVNEWHFCVGRFDPSTEVAIFLNDEETTNMVGIGAAITNSTAPFTIGCYGAGSLPLQGRASLCFLCAAALSDGIILSLYEHTKAMFNVR